MGLFGGDKKDDEDEEDPFVGRECYEFNEMLSPLQDDEACEHCKKYLTLNCKHIGEFIDDDE